MTDGPKHKPQQGQSRPRRSDDPLAELARLIGQKDPFAEFVAQHRDEERGESDGSVLPRTSYSARYAERRQAAAPAAARAAEPAYDEDETAYYEDRAVGNGRGMYAYGGGGRTRRFDTPATTHEHREARPFPPSRTTEKPPVYPPLDEDDADYSDDRYASTPQHDPVYDDDVEPQVGRSDEYHARNAPAQPAYDDPSYGDDADTNYDPDYDDEAYLPEHSEDFYEYEEPPRRRVGAWMLVSAAVVGLLVVGASGVFAYRAIFGIGEGDSTPRVVRPEAGPTKVVPGSDEKTADSGGNKQIYDRVGSDSSQSEERIVSREEQPVDVARIAPRIPQPPSSVLPFAAPSSEAGGADPQRSPVSTEPRRVRTFTVRPDGTIVDDPRRDGGGTANNVTSQPSGAPLEVNSFANQQGQGQGQSVAVTPPPRPAAPIASAPPRSSDNPWANTPASGGQSQTQAALPQRPTPAVVRQAPPPSGSYVVQVASQKTEADAQASWQSLQQRYTSVLGNQQATIRRVDLGDRGVFYRAQVGPFGSRTQASELCQSLKAAGGECVIQRN